MMLSASNENSNGGNSGVSAQTGGAADFVKNSDLGDYVDAIIGPAPSGLTEGGYKKRGSIAVSKIDASGFYYLNVEGEPGHALKTILQVCTLALAPPPSLPCLVCASSSEYPEQCSEQYSEQYSAARGRLAMLFVSDVSIEQHREAVVCVCEFLNSFCSSLVVAGIRRIPQALEGLRADLHGAHP